jgi:hypothetical protein
MGALHQIEATQGAAVGHAAPAALDAVRRALGLLQAEPLAHPAVDQATEAVAGSLGLIHELTRASAHAAQAPQAAPQPAVHQPQPVVNQDAAYANTIAMPAGAQGFALSVPEQPARAAPHPAGAAQLVEASLGAHSPSNFYKGLSGNDVIDSGGIFVATYQIPNVGTPLLIKVALPGGYEFEARGVVRWTREAPLSMSAGIEAPPGFGAQFTEISAEGRQLVYRYVRNREPLFHDDL